eukprot:GHVU01196229.1.p1 GENE.GHVU01196229.1~~GHVU01196229.1.p1  ORF type:complete len:128 (-),score=2.27 GHVU01196229.1:98-481(-)
MSSIYIACSPYHCKYKYRFFSLFFDVSERTIITHPFNIWKSSQRQVDVNVYVRKQMELFHKTFCCARRNISTAQHRYKTYYDLKIHGPNYVVGQKVWIYDPFVKLGCPKKCHVYWKGPYEIIEIINS